MNTLPQLGEMVQIFGVGCEGCGSFHGNFEVAAVVDASNIQLVLIAHEVDCDGAADGSWFSRLAVDWNQSLQCWQAECRGHSIVISIGRHYRGPVRAAA
jgi:hypothetical protein